MRIVIACALALGCTTTPAKTKPGAPPDPSTNGAICTAVGNVCGADGVTNGDADSAYVCAAVGAAPVSAMKCTQGCSAGQCTTGVTGDCVGAGLYCGGDQMSGDPSSLFTCPGAGLAPSAQQACPHGCQVNPPGTNDECASAGATCPGGGDYCGGDVISGDPNTLYHCDSVGSAPSSSEPCSNGCSIQPSGSNDYCQLAQSCPGAGAYCGSDGVQGGDGNTLYDCPGAGMAPTSGEPCSMGCTTMPAGTNDFCSLTTACPTGGDYCGNDGLNGPSGVLFHCAAAGQPPASWTACDSGCVEEPQGTNDVCGGGACGTYGAAALHWEASQLNSGNSWSDYCLGFVNQAFQAAGDYLWWLQEPNANASLADAEGVAGFTWWNGSCPCGAILYWAANACNGEWGHIVICNGDGTVSTSGWPGYAGSTSASISWLDGEECGYTPTGYLVP
jgi:hypothetical protein